MSIWRSFFRAFRLRHLWKRPTRAERFEEAVLAHAAPENRTQPDVAPARAENPPMSEAELAALGFDVNKPYIQKLYCPSCHSLTIGGWIRCNRCSKEICRMCLDAHFKTHLNADLASL